MIYVQLAATERATVGRFIKRPLSVDLLKGHCMPIICTANKISGSNKIFFRQQKQYFSTANERPPLGMRL